MIEIRDVVKEFVIEEPAGILSKGERKAITVLDHVSFKVKRGECFGIIGKNGSGKTTLLKLMSGIIKPSSGEVITKERIMPFLDIGMGFDDNLTGRENIYLYGSLIGLSSREIDANMDYITYFSGLKDFMNTKLKKYSAGMRVRLAFSTVMAADPSILLIDEIIAVGDEEFQRKSLSKIESLKDLGKTIVVVSHDLGLVKRICDRAICLDSGHIAKSGDPDDVVKHYLAQVRIREIDLQYESVTRAYEKFQACSKAMDDFRKGGREHMLSGMPLVGRVFSTEQRLRSDYVIAKGNIASLIKESMDVFEKEFQTRVRDNPKLHQLDDRTREDIGAFLERFSSVIVIARSLARKSELPSLAKLLDSVRMAQIYVVKDIKMRKALIDERLGLVREQMSSSRSASEVFEQYETLKQILFNINMLENDFQSRLYTVDKFRELTIDDKRIDRASFHYYYMLFLRNVIFDINTEIDIHLLRRDSCRLKGDEKGFRASDALIESLKACRLEAVEKLKEFDTFSWLQDTIRPSSAPPMKDIRIEGVSFTDLSGNRKDRFICEEPFCIRIDYFAGEKIENPVFGVGIFKDDFTLLSGSNTKFHNFRIDHVKGKGTVTYKVDSLPLLEGTYLVSVSVHPYDSFVPFDLHEKRYSFEVMKRGTEEMGVMHLVGRWEVKGR